MANAERRGRGGRVLVGEAGCVPDDGRDFALIAVASLLFTAPPQVIQAYVLEQGFGHGFFGTMVAAIPLMTIVVSVPMLGVRPTGHQLFGVLGGLGCIFLLVEDGVHRGMSAGLLALTMVIPLSSALSNTFYKWKLPHVPAAPLTTMMLLVSAVALLPLEAAPRFLNIYGIGMSWFSVKWNFDLLALAT